MMVLAANSMESKAENYVRRIRNLKSDIASEKGACGAKCKELNSDIRDIYAEAKENGLPVKSLRQYVKSLELEDRLAALAVGLDTDEAAVYETLRDIGPLGVAASERAGYGNGTADDDRDLRPPHLQNLRNTDPDDLEKLGRGPQ